MKPRRTIELDLRTLRPGDLRALLKSLSQQIRGGAGTDPHTGQPQNDPQDPLAAATDPDDEVTVEDVIASAPEVLAGLGASQEEVKTADKEIQSMMQKQWEASTQADLEAALKRFRRIGSNISPEIREVAEALPPSSPGGEVTGEEQ